MWEKINKVYIGIILGVIIPFLFYMIFYYSKMQNLSYIGGSYKNIAMQVLPIFLTRCIFPNAVLFFLFIWKNQLQIGKGLLISTGVLTAILLIMNFAL